MFQADMSSTSLPSDKVHWLLQLAHILFQYVVLMLPGAIIVYTVKQDKLCPPYGEFFLWIINLPPQLLLQGKWVNFLTFSITVKSFPLIQWFVYGKFKEPKSLPHDPEAQTCDSSDEDADTSKKLRESNASSNAPSMNFRSCALFAYCFIGLQVSYLTWGILQEKIMTTEYNSHSQMLSSEDHGMISLHENSYKIRFRNSQFLVLINRIFSFTSAVLILILYSFKDRILSLVTSVEYVRLVPADKKQFQSMNNGKDVYIMAPFYKFSYCSVTNILSSWCQYEALKYVNFPTQVLSKACKLIPVMVMSYLVSGKRYKLHEYNVAILISVGISFFLLGNHMQESKEISPSPSPLPPPTVTSSNTESNDTTSRATMAKETLDNRSNDVVSSELKSYSLVDGILILSLYLTFDSFTSNWQEKLNKEFNVSPLNMMASVNFYSCLFTFSSLASQALVFPLVKLVFSCPELLHDCLILSFCSVTGQLFIYYTIAKFGALTFTFMMTIRQSLAILLSCLIYGHELNVLGYSGITLVFTAVFLQLYFKWKK